MNAVQELLILRNQLAIMRTLERTIAKGDSQPALLAQLSETEARIASLELHIANKQEQARRLARA